MPIVIDQKQWGAEYIQAAEPHKVRDGLTWYDTINNELKVWDSETFSWRWVSTGSGARFGYTCGGGISDHYSGIQKLDFPFDSAILLQIGNIETTRNTSSSGCNSSKYGFIINGDSDIPYNSLSSIRRFEFPFDSGLAQIVGYSSNKTLSSACNSSQHGYSIGGAITDGINITSTLSSIDRITFPFNSGIASVVGNILSSRAISSACNSSQHGYSIGGTTLINNYSYVERILFPFNSGTSTHDSLMIRPGYYNTSFNSSQYAYTCQLSLGLDISSVDRFLFPFNSGVSTVVGTLAYSTSFASGLNSTKTGYMIGGQFGSIYIDVQELNFPFNSGIAVRRGVLSSRKLRPTAIDGVDFVTQLI